MPYVFEVTVPDLSLSGGDHLLTLTVTAFVRKQIKSPSVRCSLSLFPRPHGWPYRPRFQE